MLLQAALTLLVASVGALILWVGADLIRVFVPSSHLEPRDLVVMGASAAILVALPCGAAAWLGSGPRPAAFLLAAAYEGLFAVSAALVISTGTSSRHFTNGAAYLLLCLVPAAVAAACLLAARARDSACKPGQTRTPPP